jgi:hypothetical protein
MAVIAKLPLECAEHPSRQTRSIASETKLAPRGANFVLIAECGMGFRALFDSGSGAGAIELAKPEAGRESHPLHQYSSFIFNLRTADSRKSDRR